MASTPGVSAVGGGLDRPACDRCKARKTKCDRESPCSVCVTAGVSCKYTRQRPEKRQRVLLSSKYDEALQGVNQRLTEISKALQDISAVRQPVLATEGLESTFRSSEGNPTYLLDGEDDCSVFRGETSFQAHARDIEAEISATEIADESIQSKGSERPQPLLVSEYPHLAKRPLAPMGLSQRILSLAQREPQRIFFEVPVVDVEEMNDICKKVYLDLQKVSSPDWITFNVVLLYLFTNLDEDRYSEIEVTETEVHDIEADLESNCAAVIKGLRLCTPPSKESCRATALLANYALRTGNHSTAFRLITFSARACLDLGYHRSPSSSPHEKIGMFWHVYALERYLAFTQGRTPTIHHYDITSAYRPLNERSPLVLSGLGVAFVELAYLVGQIQLQLFSATARSAESDVRLEAVERLAAQLETFAQSLQKLLTPDDESSQGVFGCLSVMVYCYLTAVYFAVPPELIDAQSEERLIGTARKAIEALLQFSRSAFSHSLEGWARLLNVILAFAPLVPILVLARSTIVDPSQNHLDLLEPIMALIGVAAPISPAANTLLAEAGKLYLAAKDAVGGSGPSLEGH